jgi:hypothetical protein
MDLKDTLLTGGVVIGFLHMPGPIGQELHDPVIFAHGKLVSKHFHWIQSL